MSIPRLFHSASWEQRPVVILLGWLGSEARYFNKYVDLWRDLGAHTIGIRPTILQTGIPSLADRTLLRFMGDVNQFYGSHCLARGKVEPLFLHTFSNAGFLALGTMLHLTSLLSTLHSPLPPAAFATPDDELLGFSPRLPSSSASSTAPVWPPLPGGAPPPPARHPYLEDHATLATLQAFHRTLSQAAGIVIDSAPSQPDPHIWSRGLLSAALGRPASDIQSSYPLAVRTLQGLLGPYLKSKAVKQRYAEIQQAWQDNVPACPQLYLYSEIDSLIPAEQVRAFIHMQREHGASVQARCWPDSAHCEHYRKHPAEYKQLLRDFVDHCSARGSTGWRRQVPAGGSSARAHAAVGG